MNHETVIPYLMAQIETLLSPAQVAELLGIKPATLRLWRRIGRGPAFIKLSPGTIRYSEVALEQFIAGRAQPSGDRV